MQDEKVKRVGILRGGRGKENKNYASSLRIGGEIIAYLHENLADKYKPIDILIDKDNVWHMHGLPINPADLVRHVDIVWNVGHPELSLVLHRFSIPMISVSAFSAGLMSSREMLEEHIKKAGMKMPRRVVLPAYQPNFDGPRERYSIKKAKEIHAKFGAPWIIKSFTEDKSMGIHLAQTFNNLVAGIEDGLNHGNSIVVEEFIEGNAGSAHSVSGFRGQDIYIIPPSNLSAADKEKLSGLVVDLHRHLGAAQYLKSDFILHPRRGVFLTDVDFSPDVRENSHLQQATNSVGAQLHHIIGHILEGAL